MGLAFLFPAHVEGGMDADDPVETAGVCQRNKLSDNVRNPSRLALGITKFANIAPIYLTFWSFSWILVSYGANTRRQA